MLTRRSTLALGAGATAAAVLPFAPAHAQGWEQVLAEFTGGAEPGEGGITLTAPELAENGAAVPVAVEAPGASEILLLATENPLPVVGRFRFGPASGAAGIATRIRLGSSQEIVALARMADGGVTSARAFVDVTVGGCVVES